MAMLSGSDLVNGLIARGFSPIHASALAGHMLQESGGNSADVNQDEGAHGLLQWRQDRWTGLQNFAKAQGRDPTDPNIQLDYVNHELYGPEVKAGSAFLATSDLPSASAALKPYIRFGDNSDAVRLQNAQALYAGAGGAAGIGSRAGMLTQSPAGVSASAAPTASTTPATDDTGLMQSLANVSKLIQQPQQYAPAPDLSSMQQMGRARQMMAAIRNRQTMDPTQP